MLESKLPAAKSFKRWVASKFPKVKEIWKTGRGQLAQADSNKICEFDGKEVDIKLDANRKEWFCGKMGCI